jgi:hypothetical protein
MQLLPGVKTLRVLLPALVFTFSASAAICDNAACVDLTTAGASFAGTAAVGGSYVVQQIDPQSTGTGVIDSFLRIQQTGQESGFNTGLSTPLDDKGGSFTRPLTLAEIPTINISGTLYLQFLLDINQLSPSALLSLNQIQIFTRAGDTDAYTLSDPTSTSQALLSISGATERFRLNNTADDREIVLNYNLNPGSGAGDMFLNVAASLFSGLSSTTNVFLFSQFGAPPGQYSSNDGFEEWSVLTPASAVPEPTSVVLFGTVLVGVGLWLRKRVEVNL